MNAIRDWNPLFTRTFIVILSSGWVSLWTLLVFFLATKLFCIQLVYVCFSALILFKYYFTSFSEFIQSILIFNYVYTNVKFQTCWRVEEPVENKIWILYIYCKESGTHFVNVYSSKFVYALYTDKSGRRFVKWPFLSVRQAMRILFVIWDHGSYYITLERVIKNLVFKSFHMCNYFGACYCIRKPLITSQWTLRHNWGFTVK